MNIKKLFISAALMLAAFASVANAQEDKKYIEPLEEGVKQRIRDWQDQKFGLFIHWGTYSVTGVIESWSLDPRHIEWCYKFRPKDMSYEEYVRSYENLITQFNPVSFDPETWAKAAKYAGMKYMVFTTKHHDGFSMFDTQQNDYKITSDRCPFHTNPKANIAKELFGAFRAEGIMPGAYFSIADWYNDDYWWDYFPPKDASPNYPIDRFPEKWNRYLEFLNAQVDELTGGEYGDLQMLWFDLATTIPLDNYDRIAATARKNQSDIMIVARSTGTIYENYLTPEQKIPDTALPYPWESCITMTHAWSYRPGAQYKPTRTILEMLVQIVSRGGNLLLNVGPRPDGTLEETAYERLREIGDWMQVNSEGIYGTKPYTICQDGKVCFTTKDGYVYAFYIADEDETEMPSEITFKGVVPAGQKNSVTLLGYDRPLAWSGDGEGGLRVVIPEKVRKNKPCEHIWCLKIKL